MSFVHVCVTWGGLKSLTRSTNFLAFATVPNLHLFFHAHGRHGLAPPPKHTCITMVHIWFSPQWLRNHKIAPDIHLLNPRCLVPGLGSESPLKARWQKTYPGGRPLIPDHSHLQTFGKSVWLILLFQNVIYHAHTFPLLYSDANTAQVRLQESQLRDTSFSQRMTECNLR